MQASTRSDGGLGERVGAKALQRLVDLACRVLQGTSATLVFCDSNQPGYGIVLAPSPVDEVRMRREVLSAEGEAVAHIEIATRAHREWLPAEMAIADDLAACLAHEIDMQTCLRHLNQADEPHHEEASASGVDGQELAASVLPEPVSPRVARILLADDLDLNRKLICDMLALEGHKVDGVADGREAVAAAAGGQYDLILMDMIMPIMDGLAATREIRALPAPACDVPIVALTAHSFREQLDSCIAAGMNGTLSKPMTLDALTSAVAAWTSGRKAA